MSTTQPPTPQPTSSPQVVQQTTIVHVGATKSVGLAILLAFLFGPLGMLYATVLGAIVLFIIDILILVPTAGIGLFITWVVGIIWAGAAASSHNKGLGVATQSIAAVQAPPASAPAGWYPDFDGSGRQRYWDGRAWTEHIHDPAFAGQIEEATGIEGT